MSKLQKEKFWEELKSGRFASMVKEASQGKSVSNSNEVYNIMKPLFAESNDVETIYCIFLNAKNKILAIEKMFSGSLTASAIYPREIVKRLIALKASALVMAHNHPSGDPTPSPEDKSITIRIGLAISSIDATFHDHIIVGDGYHSMADTGWFKKISRRFSELFSSEYSEKAN